MRLPTAVPHLLRVPREIRNHIYAYLHHDLELRTIERLGASQVFVSLTNVPYTSVFRAHSQLNTEYRESGPKDVSAYVNNLDYSPCEWIWSDDTETVRRDNAALAQISKVTVRFQSDRHTEGANCKDLLDALTSLAPDLHTIRIMEYTVLRSSPYEPNLEFLGPVLHNKLPPLASTLAQLPLVQRANCRSITTHLVSEPPLPPQYYGIVQYRTHVYSNRRSPKDLFRSDELFHSKWPRSYREWVRKLYKEKKIVARDTYKPEKVVGWKEYRWDGGGRGLCQCECGCTEAL